MTAGNYQTDIAAVLAVPAAPAAAIAAQYPPAAYPSPAVALSTLVGDASFAFPALQVDQLTAQRVPTFAYEFNDDAAPEIFGRRWPPAVATHGSELQYLFDLPNAPVPGTLNAGQQALAASMRAAWANFAGQWQPFDRGDALVRIRRRGPRVGVVPRRATATARDRLRRQASLLVLGRQVTPHRRQGTVPAGSSRHRSPTDPGKEVDPCPAKPKFVPSRSTCLTKR